MMGLAAAWASIKRTDWRILAAIVAVLVIAIALYRWTERLKESGRAEVRQEWAEAQRRADLKQMAKVEAQQKQINAVDSALANTTLAQAGQADNLEKALADEKAKKPAKQAAVVCPDPPMPDSVRNALNATGRTNR